MFLRIAVETACDQHGWILGYTVHPGNEHDSRTFKALYEKIKPFTPSMVIADAGCRIPNTGYCKGTVVRRYKTTTPV